MKTKTKILIVEHDQNDIDLIQFELKKGKVNHIAQVVQTEKDYESALRDFEPDIILSDYTLPSFSGPIAFEIKEHLAPDTPFIYVSGTIGEENSIELLRNGATDFALKEKLYGLPNKVIRALKEAKEKQQLNEAQADIKASEARYHSLFDNMIEGFAFCKMIYENGLATDFIYLEVNHAFEELTGLENVIGKKVTEVIPTIKQDMPELFETYSRVAITEKSERIEIYLKALDMWLDISVYSYKTGYFTAVFDVITVRKKAEELVITNEKRFRALIEKGSDMITLSDVDGNMIYGSPSITRILGYSLDEFLQMRIFNVIHPDDTAIFLEKRKAAVLMLGNSFQHEMRLQHKNGNWVWCEGTFKNMLNEPGINALVSNFKDITERKSDEEKLYSEKAKLNEAQAMAHVGSWEIDMATNIHTWSDEFYQICGFKKETIPSAELFASLAHPDDSDFVNKKIAQAFNTVTDSSFDFRFIRTDGAARYGYSKYRFEFDQNKKPLRLYGIVQDVTEKKIAENKISELNQTLQTANHQQSNILNALPANIALLDGKGNIIAIDEAWKQFAVENHMLSITHGLGDNYISICEKATGSDKQTAMQMAMGLRKILDGTLNKFGLEYPCDSPTERRWFRVEVRPLAEKENSGAVVMHINITERKKGEREIIELNESLERKVKERTAQLMEINSDLESFGYSVSHDLRSPLQVINGYSSILLKKYTGALDEDAQSLLQGIRTYTKKMSEIMESLLNLSRLGLAAVEKTMCHTNEMVKAVILELKRANKDSKVEMKVQHMSDAGCDSAQLKQVWVNLISNAIKYSSQKEKPVIEIGSTETDGEVVYHVKDNGAGFDMKYADRLFSPFQRLHTASEFEGTGIGLTIVHRIIAKHGGKIWAKGEVGKGATFYFTLAPAKNKISAAA